MKNPKMFSVLLFTFAASTPMAYAHTHSCAGANIEGESLALTMGILNKMGLEYKVLSRDQHHQLLLKGRYRLLAKAKDGSEWINGKLVTLINSRELSSRSIEFERSTVGECDEFDHLPDLF